GWHDRAGAGARSPGAGALPAPRLHLRAPGRVHAGVERGLARHANRARPRPDAPDPGPLALRADDVRRAARSGGDAPAERARESLSAVGRRLSPAGGGDRRARRRRSARGNSLPDPGQRGRGRYSGTAPLLPGHRQADSGGRPTPGPGRRALLLPGAPGGVQRNLARLHRQNLEAGVRLVPEIGAGIDCLSLDQDLVVQVRAGGASRVAGPPDDRSSLDALTRLDVQSREVAVEALDVLSVVQDDGDAVLLVRARHRDRAGGRRAHRRAVLRADVDAAVELGALRPRRLPHAVLGIDGAAYRPARRQRRQRLAGPRHAPVEGPPAVALLGHALRAPVAL